MEFDASAQVDALAKLPPEPAKPAERSAWGWVPRITKAAVAGVAGSVADVVKGAAAADAMTLGADPRARGAFTAEQLQAGQQEGERQIATGEAMTSDLGDSFRQVQKDARPDPVTAGTAERLVFGVAEPMLKLIGAGMTMGPIGLGLSSAEMGLQQADELRQQGVDVGTRTAVGALTAGITAASVALPLSGPTLKATAGLYLAGGPGGYVAQQALTSKILEHAGYAKIAEQFDPFDPMGLAMSALIPLPFAAHGAMRNVRAMKPAKGAAPVSDVPAAPEAPTVPRETVDAAMVHNLTLQRDVQNAVVRDQSPLPDVDRAWRDLKEAPRLSDFGVRPATNVAGSVDDFVLSRQQGKQWAALNVREHRADGGEVVYTSSLEVGADGFPKGTGAATTMYIEALNIAKQRGMGWQSEGVRSDNALAIYRNLTDAGIPFKEVDGASTIDAAALATVDLPKVAQALADAAAKKAEALGAAQAKPDAIPPPKPDPAPAALSEAVAKAREELAAFQASGKPLADFVVGRDLPPAVNNLLIGLAETMKNPARTKALLDMVGKSDPKADPANVTADSVERMRALTDEQITNTQPDALMQSVSDRVAAVEMTNPDMVVGVDDSGNPITVRDELARIRREAAEGTDTTLGGADADLVNVAANCALTNGG